MKPKEIAEEFTQPFDRYYEKEQAEQLEFEINKHLDERKASVIGKIDIEINKLENIQETLLGNDELFLGYEGKKNGLEKAKEIIESEIGNK